MYSKRTLTALALSVAALAPVPGMASNERIAVFTKNQTNPFFQYVRLGANSAAAQLNVKVQHYIPTKPDSIPEQLSQVEDVVVKKPDAVVFIPVDNKAMVPAVIKMNAAGIPVVNVTDRIDSGRIVSFVGADDFTLGVETGRYLLKSIGGKGNVVIIEGVKAALSSNNRLRGFRKALEEYPDVKVLASQPANNQRLQALQVMENLLQTHQKIDGVFAVNDAMATGVIEALDAAKRKPVVVGINGTKEAIEAIKVGKLAASGDYASFLQGCFGVMAAVRELRKLPVPSDVAFPPVVIDSSNVRTYDVAPDELKCPPWDSIVSK